MTGVVDHLVRLGLSEYEAKAYVATVAIGEGTIKQIHEESGVPRSRVYDVMEKLAERGLVDVGSSSPKCYRAIEPITASNYLMEDVRKAGEEALRELSKIGRTAETKDNPIWTVKGDWAIDHKVSDILASTEKEVVILCFLNKNLIRYAKIISQASQQKQVTVVVSHQGESFTGLLGKSRIMSLKPTKGFLTDSEGSVTDKGFITRGGKYNIELAIHSDRDETLLITREGEDRRALMIIGTILNFFSHETLNQVVHAAEDVVPTGANARSLRVP